VRALHLGFALLAAAAVLHPQPPPPAVSGTGGVNDAVALLARLEETDQPRATRTFTGEYKHWSGPKAGAVTPPPEAKLERPSPVAAGIVAVATALGLKDVAALTLYLMADEAEDSGDYVMNDICLRAIPMVDPHFVDAYILLAFVRQTSEPERAAAYLREGLKWNPLDWELWYDLAWIYLRPRPGFKPDYELALTYLKGCLQVSHPYFVNRVAAMVLMASGKRALGLAHLRELLMFRNLPEQDRIATERLIRDGANGIDRLSHYMERRHQ
jgi:tetratricopeptide (TPR) repeat protein